MPYTTKSFTDVTSLADTVTGPPGNTASVPGWRDVAGFAWCVQGGAVACGAADATLANVYAEGNPAANQEVVVDFEEGLDAQRAFLIFRHRDYGSHSEAVRVYLNLAGTVYVQETGSFGATNPATSPPLGLAPGKGYRFTLRNELAAGVNTLTVTVFNLTDGTPHVWNSGAATWSASWTISGAGAAGGFHLMGDTARYQCVDYRDDQAAPTPVPGKGAVTAITDTSLTVQFPPTTGGVPPFVATLHRGPDIYFTPGVANLVAACEPDGSAVHTDAGLSPDTIHAYKQKITDALGQEAVSGIVTETTGAKTRPVPVPAIVFYSIGDSITVGGEVKISEVQASVLAGILCVPVAAHLQGVPGGGLPNFVDAAGSPTPTLVNTVALAGAAGATDIQLRIGINDVLSPPDWQSRMAALVAYVRGRKAFGALPELLRLWLLSTTFRHGAPDNFVPDGNHPLMRDYWEAQLEICASDGGCNGLRVLPGTRLVYELMSLRPDLYLPNDGIHPNQSGNNLLGTLDAHHWLGVVYGGGGL